MPRFYYGDGTEYEGPNPPARDVQVILQADDRVGPHFVTGADYYILRGEKWLGVDIFGLYDYLLDSGIVLFGRTINNAEYQAIYKRAKVEKQTWLKTERKL